MTEQMQGAAHSTSGARVKSLGIAVLLGGAAPIATALGTTAPTARAQQAQPAPWTLVIGLESTRHSPGAAFKEDYNDAVCLTKPPRRASDPLVVLDRAWERYHGNVESLVKEGVTDENRSKVVAAIRKHAQVLEGLREKVA